MKNPIFSNGDEKLYLVRNVSNTVNWISLFYIQSGLIGSCSYSTVVDSNKDRYQNEQPGATAKCYCRLVNYRGLDSLYYFLFSFWTARNTLRFFPAQYIFPVGCPRLRQLRRSSGHADSLATS